MADKLGRPFHFLMIIGQQYQSTTKTGPFISEELVAYNVHHMDTCSLMLWSNNKLSDPNLTPLPMHPGINRLQGALAAMLNNVQPGVQSYDQRI